MRDLFLKDLGWKLLSLFLAVAIWLTVHKILTEAVQPVLPEGDGNANSTATTFIYSNQPVEIVSPTTDVHLYRTAPEEVKVTLAGPADLMADLQASQIHAVVDLTDTNVARSSHRQVEISPPPGVTLIGVEPPRVLVIPPPGR
jgi:YbbR domain-containing protein